MSSTPFSELKKKVVSTVDAKGMVCPLPLLKTKQGLNSLGAGECLEVLATDATAVDDIRTFISMTQHRLLYAACVDGIYLFIIQKF